VFGAAAKRGRGKPALAATFATERREGKKGKRITFAESDVNRRGGRQAAEKERRRRAVRFFLSREEEGRSDFRSGTLEEKKGGRKGILLRWVRDHENKGMGGGGKREKGEEQRNYNYPYCSQRKKRDGDKLVKGGEGGPSPAL